MRVITPGSARTVSFHPASVGSGGTAGPIKRMVPLSWNSIGVERAAVENLESHQVKMDGV